MTTTRERLFQRGSVKRETLTIGTGEDAITIEVRGLTAGQRGTLQNEAVHQTEDGDRIVDQAKFGPMLVVASAYDPTTGQPVFSEADVEAVAALDADFLDPIIEVAGRLSGLGKDALKGAEKNSEPTT